MCELHTTIFSVLVKADKHADNFKMFFSKLQKRDKTGGKFRQLHTQFNRQECSALQLELVNQQKKN